MIKRPGVARLAVAGAALTLAAGLTGCITLFPKEKPVQLYRFDAAVQAAQGSGRSVAIRSAPADFDTPAGSDQIMTVDGDQIGYVDSGRWSSPANLMFDEAVAHGFEVAGDGAHLIGPSGKAQYRLHLTVSRFEARYASGPTAPPTIVVTVRAVLERQSDLSLVGAQTFESDVPASDNRVGPIVTAYDTAVTKVVGDMVAWVDEKSAS